jgi:cytochrome c oxidase cbb3-type subunit 3
VRRRPDLCPRLHRAAWLAILVTGLAACHGGGDEVRPWKPEDHDNTKAARAVQTSGVTKPGEESATLVAITWAQNCVNCHGPRGRGDGPQGRMLRVADLSRPEWQGRVTDEAIANVIRKGRNKMPAFESLPPKVVDGLVAFVRALKR